jgi:hypothetical protein
MSIKDIIDFSDFVTPEEALDLFRHGVRKAFQYDSYAGQNRFVALVLSNPIPMASEDISIFSKTPVAGTFDDIKRLLGLQGSPRRISKFSFRARVLGNNSPHLFLPDPCDPAYTPTNNAELLKLISMHTLFMSTENYQLQAGKLLPNRGDLVLVELENNVFGYDLQRGTFIDVIESTDATHNIGSYVSSTCSPSLVSSFGGMSAGGGGGGGGGVSPPGLDAAGTRITPFHVFPQDITATSATSQPAFVAWLQAVTAAGYTYSFGSVRRGVKHQFNLVRILPAGSAVAAPCFSNHQYGDALDITFSGPGRPSGGSKTSDPYRAWLAGTPIVSLAQNQGIKWYETGRSGPTRDAVHFSKPNPHANAVKQKCINYYYNDPATAIETIPPTVPLATRTLGRGSSAAAKRIARTWEGTFTEDLAQIDITPIARAP